MFKTVVASHSYKTKVSVLEFVKTFIFTNFMPLCLNKTFVKEIEDIVVSMLADDHVNVSWLFSYLYFC